MQTHEDKQKVWFTFTSQVKEKALKQPLSKTMANLFFHSCREKMAARQIDYFSTLQMKKSQDTN